MSKAYLAGILLLSIAVAAALYAGKIHWGALGYSLSLFVGLCTLMVFVKRRGVKLNLVELFLTPLATSLLIVLLWQSVFISYGIPVGERRITTLGFLVLMFLVFLAVISLFEMKRTVESVRFIYKRLTQGNL